MNKQEITEELELLEIMVDSGMMEPKLKMRLLEELEMLRNVAFR